MSKKNQIWFDHPAAEWEEVHPIGNGKLGAMIWGAVETEKLGLNLDTLWSGIKRDTNNYEAKKYLEPTREKVFEGKYTEAAKMVEEHLLGNFGENYLPMGNLSISVRTNDTYDLNSEGAKNGKCRRETNREAIGVEPQDITTDNNIFTDYKRTLDLDEGLVQIIYKKNGCTYTREYLASYPDQAIVMRDTSSIPADYTFELESELLPEIMPLSKENQAQGMKDKTTAGTQTDDTLREEVAGIFLTGRCPEHVEPSYLQSDDPIIWGTKGICFQTKIQILDTDGVVTFDAETKSLVISGATYFDAAIQSVSGNRDHPQDIPQMQELTNSYQAIKEAHQKDYKAIFDRVDIELGETPELPINQRLVALREGAEDPQLYALFFQYGRYLLLSSSREGSEAANLQGIWNWEMRAPWSSNYTTNINLEMNYWPAQVCNLSECMEPYFTLLEQLVEPGKKTAQVHFGCRGFCVGHNTDYWRTTNPMGIPYGQKKGIEGSSLYSFFMLSGQWLCSELWKAYEYNKNADFLEKFAFPILKESALFLVDFLVEKDGYYLTCPSASPENQFKTEEGVSPISMGSTIEMTIVRETFQDYIKMYQELERVGRMSEDKGAAAGQLSAQNQSGIEQQMQQIPTASELLTVVQDRLAHLLPYQVAKDGRLQEWIYPFEETEKGHRHISHAYGLFPGKEFQNDEVLKEACRKSIDYRLANGGGHTGWSCAWIANFYAVLEEHEKAYEYMKVLLTRSTYQNLWTKHPPFQIDANFAGTMAMAQMFVQEKNGEVQVLPALPKEWKRGYVKGLCLTDNRTIDIVWENDKVDFTIKNTVHPKK